LFSFFVQIPRRDFCSPLLFAFALQHNTIPGGNPMIVCFVNNLGADRHIDANLPLRFSADIPSNMNTPLLLI
jgi:hypothetical protein